MPFYSRAKKTFKRGARAVTKAAGKRYNVSYGRRGLRVGKNSVSRLAKDVQMIKSRLNSEKKFVGSNVTTAQVAQANHNAFGYYAVDLTPVIPQGDGESQRVGNSLKLTGFHQKLQFIGQGNCQSNRRLKMHMICTTDSTSTNDQIIADVYDTNPLTGFIDYHSNFNYSNMKRAHKIVAKRAFTLRTNTVAGNDQYTPPIGDTTLGMKMQALTRFEGDADNTPKDQRYILVILCDTGNRNPSSSTTNNGVLVTGLQTGVEIQHHYRWYYVDN